MGDHLSVRRPRCPRAGPTPRGTRLLLPFLLVILLVMAGCGGGDPAPTATGETTAPTPTATVGSKAERVLTRRDAPPAGVARQAEFWVGAGGECDGFENYTGPPAIEIRPGLRLEVPVDAEFCFPGFSTDVPLHAEVRSPDGKVIFRETLTCCIGGGPLGFRLLRLPGDPLGRYTVVGRQGRDQAVLEFEVVRAERPQLLLVNQPGFLGEEIHIALGGFHPGRPVQLHLYWNAEQTFDPFQYITSFEVLTDANGAADHVLTTTPNDPPGCYGIQADERVSIGQGVCLAERRPGGEPGAVLVILASKRTERDARAELVKLRNRSDRLRRLSMVVEPTSAYPLLEPGYWIVHMVAPDLESAKQTVQYLRRDVPGVYAKRATPP
jgi:hypothetical protein